MPLSANWTTLDILALSYIRSITAVSIRLAVESSGSLEEFLSRKDLILQCKIKTDNLFEKINALSLRELAARQLELCDSLGVKVISFYDKNYPLLLSKIHYPPALLYVRGQLEPQDIHVIGIVGTRKCTHYGQLTAESFAADFVREGAVVCSGLAYGIDMRAHKAALKAGGKTYAVIASGIDKITPNYNAKFADEIAASGAVISEYRCGTAALPAYFPQRNRIISGLSRAVVVVESALSGGALITAQFCFDQDRELFAVPGNISSEKSAGTNMLIRKNMATPALSSEDVMLEIGMKIKPKIEMPEPSFSHSTEQAVYKILTHEPCQIDDLAAALAMPPQDVMSNLLMLEFKGMARQLPGKTFIRI